MSKVNIMLITYNRGEYTRRAIESVLVQSFSDWEMIIVDDGSREKDVLDIIKDFASRDQRIKFYPYEHMDIPRARQTALKYVSGVYLAIIDNDDIWADKDKLKKQVDFLDSHKDCGALGGAVIVIDEFGNEKKRYQNPITDSVIRRSILYKNPIAHSSVMMRVSDVNKVGGYNTSLTVGEDYDLYLRLGKITKLGNLSDYLVKYRRHADNRTGKELTTALKNNLKIISAYKNDYPGYNVAYTRRICRLIIYRFFSIIRR